MKIKKRQKSCYWKTKIFYQSLLHNNSVLISNIRHIVAEFFSHAAFWLWQ